MSFTLCNSENWIWTASSSARFLSALLVTSSRRVSLSLFVFFGASPFFRADLRAHPHDFLCWSLTPALPAPLLFFLHLVSLAVYIAATTSWRTLLALVASSACRICHLKAPLRKENQHCASVCDFQLFFLATSLLFPASATDLLDSVALFSRLLVFVMRNLCLLLPADLLLLCVSFSFIYGCYCSISVHSCS